MSTARILATGRFPRAAVVIEVLAIAELCRATTSALEALAASSADYEPLSLRRAAHDVVRELRAELAGQVGL